MIVILEGPDGSGKSTVAELGRQADFAVIHHGPPQPGEDVFQTYLRALLDCPTNTVFDRLFHGEAVYGPLMRGSSRLTRGQLAYLELVAAGRGAVVIWCDAESEVLKGRGDPIYARLSANLLRQRYAEVERESKLGSARYRSDEHPPERAWQQVGWIAQHDGGADRYGIGAAPDAGVVALVGEKFSEPRVRLPVKGHPDWCETPWKYCRPFSGAASRDWLFEALVSIPDYEPTGVYLTNSIKDSLPTGGSRQQLKIELEDYDRIIALGRDAEYELNAAGVKYHAAVTHPQFAKRFEHRAGPAAWGRELREVAWPS